MTKLGPRYNVTPDGKVIKRPPRKSVSDQIRERKSKRTKPISKAAASTWNAAGKPK